MGNCLVTKLKEVVQNDNLPKFTDYANTVDLGLPSGLRWSLYNIDITQDDNFAPSQTAQGSYFSWGNTDGHNEEDGSIYNFNASVYAETAGAALTGDIPLSQDAAKLYLGNRWRLPNIDDINELIQNCDCIDVNGNIFSDPTYQFTQIDGKNGLLLRSKINNNRIFFPADGYAMDGSVSNQNKCCICMSSKSNNADVFYGIMLFAMGDSTILNNELLKYAGFTIRPVAMLP